MPRKRSPLPLEVLSFLLATLLGMAIGNLTHGTGPLPWGLELIRQHPLPLAGGTILLIIAVMSIRPGPDPKLPPRPPWDSDRSPFPGLEAFTEQDSAVFFSRDAETTDLLDRLHPVIPGQANRLVTVVGPSGAGSRRWSRPGYCHGCSPYCTATMTRSERWHGYRTADGWPPHRMIG